MTDVLTEEEKSNDSLDNTQNWSKLGIQANDKQDMNTAFYKGLRLEDKFASKNSFNLSRRNLYSPEISLLSRGLKFVPSANKIDRAKLKSGTFEMISELLQLRNLDLSLLLIQGIKTLSLKVILVAWRKDCCI